MGLRSSPSHKDSWKQASCLSKEVRLVSRAAKCCNSLQILKTSATRSNWKLRLREVKENHNYSKTFLRKQQQVKAIDPTFSLTMIDIKLSSAEIKTYIGKQSVPEKQTQATDFRMLTYEQLIARSWRPNSRYKSTLFKETRSCPTHDRQREKLQRFPKSLIHDQTYRVFSVDSTRSAKTKNGSTSDTRGSNIHAIMEGALSEDLQWDGIFDLDDIEKNYSPTIASLSESSSCQTNPIPPAHARHLPWQAIAESRNSETLLLLCIKRDYFGIPGDLTSPI